MTEVWKIVCPVCHRGVNVRDGLVAEHNGRGRNRGGTEKCPMSNKEECRAPTDLVAQPRSQVSR